MINKITLRNFQNHKKTTLELSPGLNVITGSSHNGKSSIIRGIKWFVENRPTGVSFMKKKETTPTIVSLVAEEISSSRIRGKGKNEYRLRKNTYKALNGKVPEEIQDFIKMSDVNIQGQFDQFFLLQDSPGAVAKKLNSIVGLSLIDDVFKIINKTVSSAKLEEVRTDNDLAEKKEELESYNFLSEIEQDVHNLATWDVELEKVNSQETLLLMKLHSIKKLNEKGKKFKDIAVMESAMSSVLNVITKYQKLLENISSLQTVVSSVEKTKIAISKVQRTLEMGHRVEDIQNTVENYKKSTQKLESLEDIINNFKLLTNKECNLNSQIENTKSKIIKIKDKFKICPFCNQKIHRGNSC